MALAKDANKTTRIEWERYDSRATVFSDELSIVRRLLRHPLFEADQVLRSGGDPIAVEGTFPIAAIRLQCFTRKSTGHAAVLPKDAAERREYALEHYEDAGDDS